VLHGPYGPHVPLFLPKLEQLFPISSNLVVFPSKGDFVGSSSWYCCLSETSSIIFVS
jgi:hypothetical protein